MDHTLVEIEVMLKNMECEAICLTPDAKFLVKRKGELVFENGEILQYEEISPVIQVHGIYRVFVYDEDKLKTNKKQIEELIKKLFSAEFLKEGGYWSFDLFREWTEEPRTAEMLLALGIAIGKFKIIRKHEMPFIGIV